MFEGKTDATQFLNEKYKDSVTGFEGTCTAVSYFHNGCVQLLLETDAKDGKMGDSVWVDEQRLDTDAPRQAGPGGGFRPHP